MTETSTANNYADIPSDTEPADSGLFNARTVEGEKRDIDVAITEVRAMDDGTFEASLSSDAPIERGGYKEILVHEPEAVNLQRARDGLPLLFNHRTDEPVGRVIGVRVEGGRLRGRLKLSKSQRGQEIRQDLEDGILREMSIGYFINKAEKGGGEKEIRVTNWEVFEASIVGVPADHTVGVNRSQSTKTTKIEEVSQMADEQKKDAPKIDERAIREDAERKAREAVTKEFEARRKEDAQIRELAKKADMIDEGEKHIAEDGNLSDFRALVVDKQLEAKVPAQPKEADKPAAGKREQVYSAGFNGGEERGFSILRASRAMANPHDKEAQRDAGFEFEASDEIAKRLGTPAQGIYVPSEVQRHWMGQKRDLTAGTATDGAELVATNLLAGSFIEALRNSMAATLAGARMMPGLVGDVSIPRKTSDASAYWISGEDTAASESDPQFDSVTLSPKMLGAWTDISRQLQLQSTPAAEGIVRESLTFALADAIDNSVFYGTGSSGQPLGIKNNTDTLDAAGSSLISAFAGAEPTFAELMDLFSAIADANALGGPGDPVYVTAMDTASALMADVLDSGSGRFIFENVNVDGNNVIGGRIGGFRAFASGQITSGDVFLGKFDNAMIGMWGGLDIVVDPYTSSTKGKVRLVALQNVDVALRHGQAFAYNT